MTLLEVRGVSKRFGGVQAVQGVSFDVRQGDIKAVIGPNGAGKSTLFNLLTGVTAPDAGEVRLEGTAIHGRPPHQVAARGVARTFQHLRLFAGMTARENVMVGAHLRVAPGSWPASSTCPGPGARRPSPAAPGRPWRSSAPRRWRSRTPGASPTGSSGPSSWPARSPPIRACSSWTSPPPASTCGRPPSWPGSWSGSATGV